MSESFSTKLSKEERQAARLAAAKDGRSGADWLRRLVRKAVGLKGDPEPLAKGKGAK